MTDYCALITTAGRRSRATIPGKFRWRSPPAFFRIARQHRGWRLKPDRSSSCAYRTSRRLGRVNYTRFLRINELRGFVAFNSTPSASFPWLLAGGVSAAEATHRQCVASLRNGGRLSKHSHKDDMETFPGAGSFRTGGPGHSQCCQRFGPCDNQDRRGYALI